MRSIKILSLIICTIAPSISVAQNFKDNFCDSTLRIDYIFAGNTAAQTIAIDKLNVMPGWYGKRQHMDELPVEGNGRINVCDHITGDILYSNSFSTLFQEWLTFDELKNTPMSFENVFLVPMPKNIVDITISLYNNRREIMTSMTHTFDPSDILIRRIGYNNVMPYDIILEATNPEKCIHIAYVAEGYTEEEMETFIDDVHIANEALFSHEPFKSMKDKFNVIAVKQPSRESGASEPANGIWRDTALGSHFDTFYSSRYLTTLNLKKLHDCLAGTPYEHIIVLVNTEKYGGGGILNSYELVSAHHKMTIPVVVHEFGHSFAGLADEYAYENEAIPMYPYDVEPWEKNITTLVDFHDKWEDMVKGTEIKTLSETDANPNKASLYEGAGYSMSGIYRAFPDCRMRTNTTPDFCAVCQRAIRQLIEFYTK